MIETKVIDCNVKIKIFDGGKKPQMMRPGDACFDCYARLAHPNTTIRIPANSRCLVNLGFALELPEDWEAVIRPRSGLTSKKLDVAIGTIDSGYRGEVKVCVINNSEDTFDIQDGMRVCQMAIRKIPTVLFTVVDELSDSERGDNGFGSSGV